MIRLQTDDELPGQTPEQMEVEVEAILQDCRGQAFKTPRARRGLPTWVANSYLYGSWGQEGLGSLGGCFLFNVIPVEFVFLLSFKPK